MALPDITRNANSFLKALDLNGNGFVEKQELKCIAALFWEEDLSKDGAAFESAFEARFNSWDADNSGNVDLAQITKVNTKGRSFALDKVPKSCIEWFQEEANKRRASKQAP